MVPPAGAVKHAPERFIKDCIPAPLETRLHAERADFVASLESRERSRRRLQSARTRAGFSLAAPSMERGVTSGLGGVLRILRADFPEEVLRARASLA